MQRLEANAGIVASSRPVSAKSSKSGTENVDETVSAIRNFKFMAEYM